MKHFSPEGRLRGFARFRKNRWDFRTLNEENRHFFGGQKSTCVISRRTELGQRRAEMEQVRDLLQEKIRKNNTNTKFTGMLPKTDGPGEGHAL